jgi:hypothetical protein
MLPEFRGSHYLTAKSGFERFSATTSDKSLLIVCDENISTVAEMRSERYGISELPAFTVGKMPPQFSGRERAIRDNAKNLFENFCVAVRRQ